MVQRPAEVIVTLCMIGVAMAAFATSFSGTGGGNAASNDSPMQLPRILLVLWVVFGVICAARAVFWAEPEEAGQIHVKRTVVFAAVLVLTALALPFLGYLVPVTLGLFALLWCLGERDPLRFAFTLAVLGPGLWFVFHHALGLRLPLMISGGLF